MNVPHDDRLDQQLRAAFAPPAPAVFEHLARAATAPREVRRWPWLLSAAAVAAFALALLCSRPARGPEGHDGAQLGAMWAAAFEHALANGGGGGACCDPSADFGAACEQQFAVRLAAGGGVTLRGCYCGLPTGGCIAVLAESTEGTVGIFAVPRAHDPRPALPAGSDLHLARRELGGVVLYAVCERPVQNALSSFVLAP